MVHSVMCSFVSCASAARVALLMKSGQDSRSSSLVWVMWCSRLVSDMLLLTSLLGWLVLSSSCCGCCTLRLGVLMMSRNIRLCVLRKVASMVLLSVQETHPYIIVGVIVLSNSLES